MTIDRMSMYVKLNSIAHVCRELSGEDDIDRLKGGALGIASGIGKFADNIIKSHDGKNHGLKRGDVYMSGKGVRFELIDIAKYGDDCSICMVVYRNIDPTHDHDKGQLWVIDASTFCEKLTMQG